MTNEQATAAIVQEASPKRFSRREKAVIALITSALLAVAVWATLAGSGPGGPSQAATVLPRFSILNNPFAIGLSLTLFWVIASTAGYYEWKNHLQRLESIPIRVHV